MKTVRMLSIVMAVVITVVAIIPFATTPAVAQTPTSLTKSIPSESFLGAIRGLPLISPMSIALPVIKMSIENASSSGYGCSVVSQTPKDWVKMKSRQYFDMTWTIRNTGTTVWHTGSTTFAYVSGEKMQTKGNSLDISESIGRGAKTVLSVDMTAPKALGTYTALWALSTGKTKFCRVTIIVTVIK